MEFFGIFFWIALVGCIGLFIYKKHVESQKTKQGKLTPLVEQILSQSMDDQVDNFDDDLDELWIEAKKRVAAFISELNSEESAKK